jgi:RNA polymerase sigma-70 factor (ECF subfamily)
LRLQDDIDHLAVIRGLRDGRRESWAMLYDRYSTDVWRYVARLVGHPADVADVVQETFLAAARSARQFDAARGTLWGWLAGIAHHQASQYWRRSGQTTRLRALAESRAIELRQWTNGAASVDELWRQRELADVVRGVLAELPADYVWLLTAKYLDDCSLDELARETGSTVEAVKSKLARARREFRARFEMVARAEQRDPGMAIPGLPEDIKR